MKKKGSLGMVLPVFIIAGFIYWSFSALLPSYEPDKNSSTTEFSTDRAFDHVKQIAQKPHHVGSKAHIEVRTYLVEQLQKLELQPELQTGYSVGDWGNLSKATNIIAKISGTDNSKALMLLSHYDSRGHSSFGASDAGSGVATILEGVRAFLAQNKKPKNDIIIVFTDAEELGLNGATVFAKSHPWAKNVGLILNFEARGSGGPSYMLLETNGGNAELIKHFKQADVPYPVGNSLAYSIYKMLPNDTDLTVFREINNTEGINFAFIDDHFDYHTALDKPERLDKNTLKHQGSYLMPLLNYFANTDVSHLKTMSDSVYFNIPVFSLVAYPFSWIIPMLIIAIALYVLLIFYGFKTKKLKAIEIWKGFRALFITLLLAGVIGYFSWDVLTYFYPQYKAILQGFPYNGTSYIIAFSILMLSVCFWVYRKYGSSSAANSLIAPLFVWLLLCVVFAFYLKGASFFIIPVFGGLLSLAYVLRSKLPKLLGLLFFAVPLLWIVSPFVQMIPVGLGLRFLVASVIFVVLIFGLLSPVLVRYKPSRRWEFLALLVAIGFFLNAHFTSGFSAERPEPTSLLYVYNVDDNQYQWLTYDKKISDWQSGFFTDTTQQKPGFTLDSKYTTSFTFASRAPKKEIKPPLIEVKIDTIVKGIKTIEVCITPQRNVSQLEVFFDSSDERTLLQCSVNELQLSQSYLAQNNRRLFTHFITDNESTDIRLQVPKNVSVELTIVEASTDLLENKQFSVPNRPTAQIPTPFVLNDAIVTVQKIKF